MSLKEVCRACLCTGRTMSSLLESIVPTIDSPPDSVLDLWRIFTKKLITHEDSFLDQICMECLDEIQRTYSFMLKCERSEDIFKKIRNVTIYLKKRKSVTVLRERVSSEAIKSGNNTRIWPDISQIKTENMELNDRSIEDDEINANREQFQVYTDENESEIDPLVAQHDEDNLVIDLLECENDVRKDEVSFVQDIKQELDLNISMEDDVYVNNEGSDKSSIEIFKCSACLYECQLKESLSKHLIENHMEGQMCKICDKEFACAASEHSFIHLDVIQASPKSTILNTHLMIRTVERSFQCEICLSTFRLKHHLTVHLKQHAGEKAFVCAFCSKTFVQKTSLADHLRCHSEEKRFKCEICSKTFQQKNSLALHLRCHTDQKPFKCEICRKDFKQKNNFAFHLKCHTGKLEFKCETCLQTFGQKGHLMAHLRCHKDEKPFKCELCPRSFGEKCYLACHMRSHTSSKPFECKICLKKFPDKRFLKKHSKFHML